MEPEIQVSFQITGDVFPDQITKSLEILPSRTWQQGDFIQGTKVTRKKNGWSLGVNAVDAAYSLEEHVKPLLDLLLPKSKEIVRFCTTYDLDSEMSFAVYVVDETPEINFSSETIERIAQLRASVDIDIILTQRSE